MKRSVQDRKRRQGTAFLRGARENNPQEKCARRITAGARGKGRHRRRERINLSHAWSQRPQCSHAHVPHRGREDGVTRLTPPCRTPFRRCGRCRCPHTTSFRGRLAKGLWPKIITPWSCLFIAKTPHASETLSIHLILIHVL